MTALGPQALAEALQAVQGQCVGPGGAVQVVAPDGEIYVSTAKAAEIMGVEPNTVIGWVRQGKLEPVVKFKGASFYRLKDVARAERIARENAIAITGTDKQVRRKGRLRRPIGFVAPAAQPEGTV